jgi:outer membrane lipoprotein-sorting protein
MTSEGTFEQTRQGDKVMMRQEGTAHTTMKMAGNETKNETKSLFVSDGTTAWSLTDTDGQKFCTKTKIPSETDAFETMRKDFTGKVLPDEKVDGADCYVLEYTPKAAADAGAAPGTATRYVYYYRKDCGLAVKTVLFTADGKPMMTTTLSDIKLGGKVDESHFKFEPPAGVQVMDTTAPQP